MKKIKSKKYSILALCFSFVCAVYLIACSGGGSGTIAGPTSLTVTKLFLEDNWTCAVRSDNSIKCIGYNYSSASTDSFFSSNFESSKSSFNENRNCSINSTGTLWCWGYNTNGELGRGTTGGSSYLVGTPTGLGAQMIKVSVLYSACAINLSGALYCWGKNDLGQLGLNNTTAYNTPQLVSGLTVSDVAVGQATICIVSTTGLKCAGYNGLGSVGDASNTDRHVFTSVSSLPAGPTSVVTDGSAFCGLFSGGKVRCWGAGTTGALGNGLAANSNVPVTPVGLDGSVDKIAASPGLGSICALKSGEVYCWGYNNYGTVGDGSTTNRSQPTKITALGSDNSELKVSGQHACVIKSEGTVYCWGDSNYSEAGKTCSGSPCNQLTPVLMDLN
jgi:alpha-tubulin suppressor-like RCC1 family protein